MQAASDFMTRPVSRRRALAAGLAFGVSKGTAFAAAGASYPSQPIRIVVPYAAGGTSDVIARFIGQKLTERMGQPVIVENRAGGGTVIGATAAASAASDGYTLLLANNTHFINPHLMKLPYDTFKSFTPITPLATSAYLLLLNPSVAATNLQEFISLCKVRPGAINFATHGVGGLTHLGVELFSSIAGIRMQLVQYKGAGPALTAILAGEVQAYFDAPATTLPYIRAGKLRSIGVSSKTRMASLPQVPTIAEAGLRDFDVTIWYGLLGPANLPRLVVDRLNSEITRLLGEAEVAARLHDLGLAAQSMPTDDFAAWTRREYEKYGNIVRQNNITLN